MKFIEYDTVVLLNDYKSDGLKKGDIGAVVMVFSQPEAYEVEFVDDEGRTKAQVVLCPDEIKKYKK